MFRLVVARKRGMKRLCICLAAYVAQGDQYLSIPFTAKRDRKAALRFLRKAIDQSGIPDKITIDKSGANTAGIEGFRCKWVIGLT